jgi:glycosyltransferase involved in cell wall biosynthesis
MNVKKTTAKHTMMVGTALGNKGGIESVVRGYFDVGITERLCIHYYPTHCDGMRVEKILFYVKGFVKILTIMRQYRIVHVHTASWWSFRRLFPVILLAKILHKKIVIHLHGAKFDVYYSQATNLEKSIIAYGFYIADEVAVLSRQWLRKITTFCDSSKITIIPNNIPVNPLKENILKKKCEIPLIILFMG